MTARDRTAATEIIDQPQGLRPFVAVPAESPLVSRAGF